MLDQIYEQKIKQMREELKAATPLVREEMDRIGTIAEEHENWFHEEQEKNGIIRARVFSLAGIPKDARNTPDNQTLGLLDCVGETIATLRADLAEMKNAAQVVATTLRERVEELEPYKKFHDHIRAHLTPPEDVVCKICDKTAQEIMRGEGE